MCNFPYSGLLLTQYVNEDIMACWSQVIAEKLFNNLSQSTADSHHV